MCDAPVRVVDRESRRPRRPGSGGRRPAASESFGDRELRVAGRKLGPPVPGRFERQAAGGGRLEKAKCVAIATDCVVQVRRRPGARSARG